MKPHRGILILGYGLLAFLFCPFFGIAAWVMGTRDLQEMERGRMDPTGRNLTKLGRICGVIATLLIIVGGGLYFASLWVLSN